MQGSILSARIVFALLVALFAGENDSSVLVDRVVAGEVAGSYLATREAGAVALVELVPEEAPRAVATLERLDEAAHLFVEVGNERLYSLERLFEREYRLPAAGESRIQLPVYPEAMVVMAEVSQLEGAAGESGISEASDLETEGSESLAGEAAEPEASADDAAAAVRRVPTAEWRFFRSGELLYISPGAGDSLFVTRSVR